MSWNLNVTWTPCLQRNMGTIRRLVRKKTAAAATTIAEPSAHVAHDKAMVHNLLYVSLHFAEIISFWHKFSKVYVYISRSYQSQHSSPALGSNRALTVTIDTSRARKALSEKTSNVSGTVSFGCNFCKEKEKLNSKVICQNFWNFHAHWLNLQHLNPLQKKKRAVASARMLVHLSPASIKPQCQGSVLTSFFTSNEHRFRNTGAKACFLEPSKKFKEKALPLLLLED